MSAFNVALTSGCVCPGDTLIYECTVTGGVATIWTGSALDCNHLKEIVLLHNRFLDGIAGSCNNGAIVVRSLSVQGDNYTSQLNVTVTSDTAGKTIECASDNGVNITLFFSTVIPAITGLSSCIATCNQQPYCCPSLFTIGFHPPNISNVDYSSRELTLSWSPVAPDCPAIHYIILASNCGSCPTTTSHNALTCTDVPTDGSMCTFAVQTVVCGNIIGNASNPVNISTEPSITAAIDIKHPTENLTIYNSDTTETVGIQNLDTNTTPYIISISLLAAALIASVAVSIMVIVIILRKSQAKINAASEGTTLDDSMYERVTSPLPSASAINTQDNVAYGHTKTSTTAM